MQRFNFILLVPHPTSLEKQSQAMMIPPVHFAGRFQIRPEDLYLFAQTTSTIKPHLPNDHDKCKKAFQTILSLAKKGPNANEIGSKAKKRIREGEFVVEKGPEGTVEKGPERTYVLTGKDAKARSGKRPLFINA